MLSGVPRPISLLSVGNYRIVIFCFTSPATLCLGVWTYDEWGAPTDQPALGRELQDFELLIHPVIIIEPRTQSCRKSTSPHKQNLPDSQKEPRRHWG